LWAPGGDASQQGAALPGKAPAFFALSIAADGKRLAAGTGQGHVFLWELGGEVPPPAVLRWASPVGGVAFPPDGRTVASCHQDGRVILWGVATGKESRSWQFPGKVSKVAFAPDGRHLATANANGTVCILRLAAPAP